MAKIENAVNDSCSANLVFLKENRFWEDYVDFWPQNLTPKFGNALFLSAYFQILVTVCKKINIQGWSVLKGGPSVECAKKTNNLKSTLI